jgi:hypothetical protein
MKYVLSYIQVDDCLSNEVIRSNNIVVKHGDLKLGVTREDCIELVVPMKVYKRSGGRFNHMS